MLTLFVITHIHSAHSITLCRHLKNKNNNENNLTLYFGKFNLNKCSVARDLAVLKATNPNTGAFK